MSIKITPILCGQLAANAYLVCPEGRDDCFVIDPGDDLDQILDLVKDSGRKLTDILLTHGHFDHMLSAPQLKRMTGARIHVHEGDKDMLNSAALNLFQQAWCRLPLLPIEPDVVYQGNDIAISVCGVNITVMHTPGHTPGSACYLLTDENIMFSGDTVFAYGYGRVDFPGGDVKLLTQSLRRIIRMPGDITVYSGHGEVSNIERITRGLIG